ncbi:hypothetical protein PHLGIDRAFT_37234 [Phlebiopsis gigantea 11061_1 CR5-6]|uniref:Nucleolar protein 12 n=1 Tax=Phlebiopsis gigantea (strain 11061_1 CR5-6) TaxID=745531 RepID=A0A0C3PEJ3_PHLG1|nr:hypothetical protein PHLGIDRAFT_37234 [Phlebiopsis gigantea 11061_1 CR5-6]
MTTRTITAVGAAGTLTTLTGSKAAPGMQGTVTLTSLTDNSTKWMEIYDPNSGGFKYQNVGSQLYLGIAPGDVYVNGAIVKEVHGDTEASSVLIFMKRTVAYKVETDPQGTSTTLTAYFLTPDKLSGSNNESLWLAANADNTISVTLRAPPVTETVQLWNAHDVLVSHAYQGVISRVKPYLRSHKLALNACLAHSSIMSFSSFLLTTDGKKDKGKSIDKGLDNIFRSTLRAPSSATASTSKFAPEAFVAKSAKKRKLQGQETSSANAKKSRKESRAAPNAENPPEIVQKNTQASKPTSSKAKRPQDEAESSGSDDNKDEDEHQGEGVGGDSDDSDADEGDLSKLVHESVASGGKAKSASAKVKFVPSEETTEQRDARTVFVGNVPVEVVKSRPLRKQFERHILSFVPTAKIESSRFRSVAFQKPTTQLATDDSSSSKTPQKPREKDGRQHDRERAATWRATNGQEDDDATVSSGKTFLTPQEKKRIAFIKQEIHSGVDSVNAYVVFAHPVPVENRPKNLPPPKAAMDPYEAAKTVIKTADGSVFMERTIRVDFARKDKTKALEVADAEMAGDPKATVFVGSLDFACKEEDVRAFFEGLLVAERGQPPESSTESGEPAATNKRPSWVKRVRVIRDKDTLLGKGFCYVQFIDRECVDEVLALEQDRLKFAKRKLRVQRCKTLPGAPKLKPSGWKSSGTEQQKLRTNGPERSRTVSTTPISVPKGDPALGNKIAGLSKEERKKVKSTDADRVARRLAKKKAKSLAEKGVKAKETVRERVRKRPQDKKGAAPEKGKKRVRSNKALTKMNTKK